MEQKKPVLYGIDQILPFGKHQGKTIRQIFCGIRDIPKSDLDDLGIEFHDKELPSSSTFYGPWSQLDKKERDQWMTKGQKALVHYQADPSYISWLLLHTEITLLFTDIESISSRPIDELCGFDYSTLDGE